MFESSYLLVAVFRIWYGTVQYYAIVCNSVLCYAVLCCAVLCCIDTKDSIRVQLLLIQLGVCRFSKRKRGRMACGSNEKAWRGEECQSLVCVCVVWLAVLGLGGAWRVGAGRLACWHVAVPVPGVFCKWELALGNWGSSRYGKPTIHDDMLTPSMKPFH